MPGVYIKTYGCQMNERDSEQVSKMLVERGYSLVGEETEADVILLNTCSVRDMAEQKAIGKMGMLRKLREKRPHLVFGYLGCMAQARGDSLLKTSPHVDLVVGTDQLVGSLEVAVQEHGRGARNRLDDGGGEPHESRAGLVELVMETLPQFVHQPNLPVM